MGRLTAIAGWILALLAPAHPALAADANGTAMVERAIVDAVRERMGAAAVVRVSGLTVTFIADAQMLRAVPDPNARLGGPMAFKLVGQAGDGRAAVAGRATAVVDASVEHVRARAVIERGREVEEGDVAVSTEPLRELPLRRLPGLREVTGARALVNLAPGTVVTAPSVAARPAVRTGQPVEARARMGSLVAIATLIAGQDGVEGDVIRVVNKESRRELRARVVEPGVVEVVP